MTDIVLTEPITRRCFSPSCTASFTYVPTTAVIEQGLLKAADRLAAAQHRFVRIEAPDEPGGVIFYCERCHKDSGGRSTLARD